MTPNQRMFFEAFFREHYHYLVAYAFRYLKDWEDAKEVVQDSFLTAIIRSDAFFSSENPLGWMKKVIWKKASNFSHSKSKQSSVSVPIEDMPESLLAYDPYSGLDSTVARCAEILKPEEFSLFKRVVINGESCSDVAAELGLSEQACRKRVERARKKLRRNWDDEK